MVFSIWTPQDPTTDILLPRSVFVPDTMKKSQCCKIFLTLLGNEMFWVFFLFEKLPQQILMSCDSGVFPLSLKAVFLTSFYCFKMKLIH